LIYLNQEYFETGHLIINDFLSLKSTRNNLFTILILIMTLSSCSYFFVSKKSQLYYQKRDVTYNSDSSKVIEFNCYTLIDVLNKNKDKKYFVIGHCNNFCKPVNDRFLEYKELCLKSDSTYFLPIVHDYLYNVSLTTSNKDNYNQSKELYVTDVKTFRKGLNPNLNYSNQFLNYFYDNFNDTTHSNFYFEYKNQIIIFQIDYRPLDSKNMKEVLEKSVKTPFQLD